MATAEENQVIRYMVDAEERITYVGAGGGRFAEENGAGADCYPPRLPGCSL